LGLPNLLFFVVCLSFLGLPNLLFFVECLSVLGPGVRCREG